MIKNDAEHKMKNVVQHVKRRNLLMRLPYFEVFEELAIAEIKSFRNTDSLVFV